MGEGLVGPEIDQQVLHSYRVFVYRHTLDGAGNEIIWMMD